jgi:hypothetical protein
MIVNKDEEKIKYAKEIADTCGRVEGERCFQANAFVECLHDRVQKGNMDIMIF